MLAVGRDVVSVVTVVSFTSSGTKSVTGENAYEYPPMPFSSVAAPGDLDRRVGAPAAAWLGLEAVRPVGGSTSWLSARATFSLPPVLTAPA